MNGLKEYQRRRLELGDMIRAALYVARARRDEEVGTRARQLLARLARDRLCWRWSASSAEARAP
jgi:hypothetical protein